MNNIEQMKVLIAQLEALGQAELADQIQALKTKITELEAKALAEVQEVVKEVAEVLPVGFWVKYRMELIVAALLIASHVAGRFGY
jgi:hypothetical protein